ncbi:hypothetical protein O181_000368 [Austropuccinia psidii MF-1]|uniref:Uncharacterized protein n=1 Tax=Austropuccinia psidii MF-1 TaxID=1389203 RepID=A0A9Q3B8F2_9BASI|nr:hypothetical protein [Austropuccinia psidii MF-1]
MSIFPPSRLEKKKERKALIIKSCRLNCANSQSSSASKLIWLDGSNQAIMEKGSRNKPKGRSPHQAVSRLARSSTCDRY